MKDGEILTISRNPGTLGPDNRQLRKTFALVPTRFGKTKEAGTDTILKIGSKLNVSYAEIETRKRLVTHGNHWLPVLSDPVARFCHL